MVKFYGLGKDLRHLNPILRPFGKQNLHNYMIVVLRTLDSYEKTGNLG